jgi:hypothetical protein
MIDDVLEQAFDEGNFLLLRQFVPVAEDRR